jgi:hypothetical protein
MIKENKQQENSKSFEIQQQDLESSLVDPQIDIDR